MNTTGFYGKLPLRGDFVAGRLPSTFKNMWDDWSKQLVTTYDTIKQNSDSQDLWYQLPIYRFYLSGTVAGDNAWIGIMVPSCDAVGRLFPFCMARDIAPDIEAPAACTLFEPFFTALESLLSELFGGNIDFDSLEDRLMQLDTETPGAQSTAQQLIKQSTGSTACIQISGFSNLNQAEFWQTATNALLNGIFSGYSIWWTSPISKSSAETLICEAMPSADSCQGLFTGQFTQPHWTSVASAASAIPHREANALAPASEIKTEPTGDGDTNAIQAPPLKQVERITDFLELDDTDNSDAPWDK